MNENQRQPVIGIDARMLGKEQTGIGKYIARLVTHVPPLMPEARFVIFLKEREYARFVPASPNVEKRQVDAHWYSWREQVIFPLTLLRAGLDLMHFPHFNAPVLYPKKFIVTIHDVTPYFFPGHKMGSLLRRAGFWLTFTSAVHRAEKLIAVSKHTKADIISHFKADRDAIEVIYEGVDEIFRQKPDPGVSKNVLKKYGITEPFILYVGVWREHKNLTGLLRAYATLKKDHGIPHLLVLSGKENPHYGAVRETIRELRLERFVKAPGFIPEGELAHFYAGASLTVVPSFYEGFGFTGLESLACGTPVAASRVTSLPEVLGDAAFYFDPKNTEEMAFILRQGISDTAMRRYTLKHGAALLDRYKWQTAAEKTVDCYRAALKK